jgi:predicted Zn-dependent protease
VHRLSSNIRDLPANRGMILPRLEVAAARYNYATVPGRTRDFDGARRELEAFLRADPQFVDAHVVLDDLPVGKGQVQVALRHDHEAVRIQTELSRAHLGLGMALAAGGDLAGACRSHRRRPRKATRSA